MPENIAREVAALLALRGYAWEPWFTGFCLQHGLSEQFISNMREQYG